MLGSIEMNYVVLDGLVLDGVGIVLDGVSWCWMVLDAILKQMFWTTSPLHFLKIKKKILMDLGYNLSSYEDYKSRNKIMFKPES